MFFSAENFLSNKLSNIFCLDFGRFHCLLGKSKTRLTFETVPVLLPID